MAPLATWPWRSSPFTYLHFVLGYALMRPPSNGHRCFTLPRKERRDVTAENFSSPPV
jgi:hypothetical protein